MRRFFVAWCVAAAGCGQPGAQPDEPDAATSGMSGAGTTSGRKTTSASASSEGASADTSGSGWTVDPDGSTTGPAPTLDEQLAEILAAQAVPVVPLDPAPPAHPAAVALGEALFYDPLLSGNEDIACATCHHPTLGTGDGLSLSLGTGAVGLGPARAQGEHPPFVPRHAPSLLNVGDPGFTRMFWDARVEVDAQGTLRTPLGPALPPGLGSALAAQAMFPVLDRLEMRGQPGDTTVMGEVNELAALPDDDPAAIWAAVMARLLAVDGYVALFSAAYPERALDSLTFVDAANALAAYQGEAFAYPDAPWDDYLRGDLSAISDAAKFGAILFYGAAQCGNCHSGALLTDHRVHNTGIPQLGPGVGASAPFDHGRALVEDDPGQRFAFRTPTLRNVAVTAPYMHDGVLLDFEAVLVHYGDPLRGIEDLDPDGLLPELVPTLQRDPGHIEEITGLLSAELQTEPSNVGLSNLREFLETLTDPAVVDLPTRVPAAVPSGLPVP
ncbi:MAG: cytochrome-c peroxidase [Nannocystaceae bacterium]|nr:cytochrome-c peroxidase [bacterium]